MLMPSLPIGSSTPHVYVTGLNLSPHSGFPVTQIPEKSGLPSGVRGAGADGSTLPSAFRGTPAVGYFNHWALSADVHVSTNATTTAAAEWPMSRCMRGLPVRSLSGSMSAVYQGRPAAAGVGTIDAGSGQCPSYGGQFGTARSGPG